MRMIFLSPLFIVMSTVLSPAMAADSCQDIVAATIAEMRAGESDWDARSEELARTAAGSACVKAMSAGQAKTASGAVPASVATGSAAVINSENAAQPGPAETESETETEELSEEGKAGWKFLGFEVNTVDGSPSKKPYERKR